MRFWGAYLSALLHYWWTLVVVGVGAAITYVWPFLPGSVHQLPPEMGWALAYSGIVLAQVLAARRVALSIWTAAAATPTPVLEATIVVHVDSPGIGQTTVTSVLRSGPVGQNTITLTSPTADTGITAKGLQNAANDDEPEQPAAPAEPPAPGPNWLRISLNPAGHSAESGHPPSEAA
jgi:hypothetical protein